MKRSERAKYLWYDRHAAVIRHRKHILYLLLCIPQTSVREGNERTHGIVERTRKTAFISPSEQQLCKTLHWCENKHDDKMINVLPGLAASSLLFLVDFLAVVDILAHLPHKSHTRPFDRFVQK